jgi:sortase A
VSPAWRWLERAFFLVAFICLGWFAYASVEARLYQELENQQLEQILATVPETSREVNPLETGRRPSPGGLVGRIEIPRLGVSTIVRAGVDARTLQLAVGHIPGTALPGEPGNIGLAAHRDTFFRRLRHIRPDDEIRLVTTNGTFVFSVQRTRIVWPKDTWVLDATAAPTLTLVTCYPFTYVGAAPQRFIVHAVSTASVPANEPPSATARR